MKNIHEEQEHINKGVEVVNDYFDWMMLPQDTYEIMENEFKARNEFINKIKNKESLTFDEYALFLEVIKNLQKAVK